MRFDLGCVGIQIQPERFNEARADGRPVGVRVGDRMRIEIADRAIELAANLDVSKLLLCPVEPRDHIRQFLAEGRGTGRLAMGPGEHRDAGMLVRH